MGKDEKKERKPIEITHPYILIVEGQDELLFFEGFFKHFIQSFPEEWGG